MCTRLPDSLRGGRRVWRFTYRTESKVQYDPGHAVHVCESAPRATRHAMMTRRSCCIDTSLRVDPIDDKRCVPSWFDTLVPLLVRSPDTSNQRWNGSSIINSGDILSELQLVRAHLTL